MGGGEYHEACSQKQTLQNLNFGYASGLLSPGKRRKSIPTGFATNTCL
jgi:hypothetical protein